MMKNGVKKKQIDQIIHFILDRNGLEMAEEKAIYFKERALSELEKLPPSMARDALADLAEFVVNRSK